jgi:hypothetical protein
MTTRRQVAVESLWLAAALLTAVAAGTRTPAGVEGCVGDCGHDGRVTVVDLLRGVNIALGNTPPEECPAFDANVDGAITVDEILIAVNNALRGCIALTTPTPTPSATATPESPLAYVVVDTNLTACYANVSDISCPSAGASFYGQDAQYGGVQPSYRDNGDDTVTDLNTGLMWQRDPGSKQTYAEAAAGAASFNLAGYTDWRLPTIKELYSLILFSGSDPSGYSGTDTSGLTPFIDDQTFAFAYGDTSAGQRIIDSQWATSNVYGSTVLGGDECFFGVNFADGRIKCYPTDRPGGNGGYFTIYVRGNPDYGTNELTDNGNGTVSDAATRLMWMQGDNGQGVIWEAALAYCEGLSLAGHTDWRLPNAKELQSIVDYSRAPDTTGSAAIDPIFSCSPITNEAGQADYPYYWSSTTHVKSNGMGDEAAYVSFGRAMGYWMGQWRDVHGAGAQRSDPKIGNPADYPYGHGPQGDAIRIYNYVRCVRDLA